MDCSVIFLHCSIVCIQIVELGFTVALCSSDMNEIPWLKEKKN